MDEEQHGPCSWRGWLEGVTLPGGAEPGCSWLAPRGHAASPPCAAASRLLLSAQRPMLSAAR